AMATARSEYQKGNKDGAMNSLRKVATDEPDFARDAFVTMLTLSATEGEAGLRTVIQELQTKGSVTAQEALSLFAFSNAAPRGNAKKNEAFALAAADAAVAIAQPLNPITLYYLGQAYGECGHPGKGFDLISKALDIASKDKVFSSDDYASFRQALSELRKKYDEARSKSGS
nr:hypothetical protein [Fimbriimonadaceae bacterium]